MLPSMDPLHATIEEFAADGYTHIEGHRPRCRMTRLRPISWLLRISMVSVLALLCFCLVSWTAAAQETDKRHPAAMAPQGPTHLPDARWRYAAGELGRDLAHPRHLHQRRAARCNRDRLRLRAGLRQRQSRQRGGEGGRRTAFKEIYPANRRASLHRCHQGDRRHPRHPARLTRMPMRSSSRAKARPRFRKRAKPSIRSW